MPRGKIKGCMEGGKVNFWGLVHAELEMLRAGAPALALTTLHTWEAWALLGSLAPQFCPVENVKILTWSLPKEDSEPLGPESIPTATAFRARPGKSFSGASVT